MRFSHFSGGKFISIGDKIRLPDDVTMGYIIEHLLKKPLTVVEQFHSHLEPMKFLRKETFHDQVNIFIIIYSKILRDHRQFLKSHNFISFYFSDIVQLFKKLQGRMERRENRRFWLEVRSEEVNWIVWYHFLLLFNYWLLLVYLSRFFSSIMFQIQIDTLLSISGIFLLSTEMIVNRRRQLIRYINKKSQRLDVQCV